MSISEPTQSTSQNHVATTGDRTVNTGRRFTIGGAVCAVVALVFLPIILGPIGAVLGFIGYSKGDKAGLWVGIGAIVAAFLGMVLAAMVMGDAANR